MSYVSVCLRSQLYISYVSVDKRYVWHDSFMCVTYIINTLSKKIDSKHVVNMC